MFSKPKTSAGPGPDFPDWPGRLQADASLTPGLQASYRQMLEGFLGFCQRRQGGVTMALAREYLELVRLERAPSPGRLQEWKDALNWYFRRRREAGAVAVAGVPPLARTDLGQTDWEAGLIARLRQRQCSWRTEQTYRGWLWRFARFCGTGRGVSGLTPQ